MPTVINLKSLFVSYSLYAYHSAYSTWVPNVSSAITTSHPTITVKSAADNVFINHSIKHRQYVGHVNAIDPFNIIGDGRESQDGSPSHSSMHVDETTGKVPQALQTVSQMGISVYSKESNVIASSTTTTATLSSNTKDFISSTGTSTLTPLSAQATLRATQESGGYSNSKGSTSSNAAQGAAATAPSSPQDNNDSSGSNLNSWKTIGIGVISFMAILGFVLCTAFHDSILRVLRQPFMRRRGSREDDLVPDWKRASWRIGVEDEYSTSKQAGSQEDEGPRLGMIEKGNSCFMLPPVSPFPPRRPPDPQLKQQTKVCNNENPTHNLPPNNSNGYSVLQSSPPSLSRKDETKIHVDPFSDPHESKHAHVEIDAYGGIE